MTQLVDDRILSSLLRGGELTALGEPVITTGCWYVRLCQAVMNASQRTGALSEPFVSQPPQLRQQAINRLLELPQGIGLVSLRTLAPLIGDLRQRHRLNLLSMEALAAAVHLNADVFLASESPRLQDALHAEGLRFEVLKQQSEQTI